VKFVAKFAQADGAPSGRDQKAQSLHLWLRLTLRSATDKRHEMPHCA